MKISINEIFYSIQGEGVFSGTPAVFVRFAGCNRDCEWCDTEHHETMKLNAAQVVKKVESICNGNKIVVITGGEPTIQLKGMVKLSAELWKKGFRVHVETNGDNFFNVDKFEWVTVSPKEGVDGLMVTPSELKIVFWGQDVSRWEERFGGGKVRLYLQPCDDGYKNNQENLTKTIDYVMKHPVWNLSVQLHKMLHLR